VGLTPSSPPKSPTEDVDVESPSPSAFDFDAHFGYSPTPSPAPEVANQLTQEQIDMGMFKVEGTGVPGNMGPPSLPFPGREDTIDPLKRGARARTTALVPPGSRKRKDRDSEGEDNIPILARKRSRG
jgi:hypothetical protein